MRSLSISFGRSSNLAEIVERKTVSWDQLATGLTKMAPEAPSKDAVGWYIPAVFSTTRRDSETFVARHAITYDFDRVNIDTWGEVIEAWSSLAFAMYTTYSHKPEAPRFRVVLPLSRPAGFDEYQAVTRKVAADVGIELIARESFVPAQMMFAPARPLGGQFITHVNSGEWLDVDSVLAEYADWTDVGSWPRRRDGDAVHAGTERGDPLEKPGIIGAFNRAFSIEECIEKFELPYVRVR